MAVVLVSRAGSVTSRKPHKLDARIRSSGHAHSHPRARARSNSLQHRAPLRFQIDLIKDITHNVAQKKKKRSVKGNVEDGRGQWTGTGWRIAGFGGGLLEQYIYIYKFL